MAALGLAVLPGACSSEPLAPQGHPGAGGSSGGGSGRGSGGATGQGGDGLVGGNGGDSGGAGWIGSGCILSADCPPGLYCHLDGCGEYYGSCQALGTDASGGCDPRIGPVCDCDGRSYANQCDAYDNGINAWYGACPSPVGTPCLASLGGCGVGEYCRVADCNDSMGTCQAMPSLSTCDDGGEAVCGCDGGLYYGGCAAASNGVSIRNFGACPPLPSGPCSSQADCGGASYANQVTCVPTACASPAGTCTSVFSVCAILLSGPTGNGVCGCDGQTYYDTCAALSAGVSVDHQGACLTP
jgi:hypothetical protein